MPNHTRLRHTLARVEADPDALQQDTWRCETGMCFAGHTAEAAGKSWAAGPDSRIAAHLIWVDGKATRVDTWAAAYLDLSERQAAELFHWGNTLEDIRLIVRSHDPGLPADQWRALRDHLDRTLPVYVEAATPVAFG